MHVLTYVNASQTRRVDLDYSARYRALVFESADRQNLVNFRDRPLTARRSKARVTLFQISGILRKAVIDRELIKAKRLEYVFYAIDEGRHSRSGDTPYKNITLLVTAMRRIQYYNYPYMAIRHWWRCYTAIREWRRSSIFSYGDSPYENIGCTIKENLVRDLLN